MFECASVGISMLECKFCFNAESVTASVKRYSRSKKLIEPVKKRYRTASESTSGTLLNKSRFLPQKDCAI